MLKNKAPQLEISLGVSKKLGQYFPIDPDSDVTLQIQNKVYKLQKAFLRVESDYFRDLFNKDQQKNTFEIDIKSDTQIFEKILKCFYGGAYQIPVQEFPVAYMLCHNLMIESLIQQMDEFLIRNLNLFNFFTLYNMAINMENRNLLDGLHEQILEQKFDILIDNEEIFEEKNTLYPTSLVGLTSQQFIQLLKFHNKQKKQYISYKQIFDIIQQFCKVKYENNPKKQCLQIKRMTEELIDKQNLSAQEYKSIYHQELFLIDQPTNNNSLDNTQHIQLEQSLLNTGSNLMPGQATLGINILRSENILLHKQTEEQQSQNKALKDEMELLKSQMQSYLQESTKFKDFEETVTQKVNQIMEEAEQRDLDNTNRINKLEQQLEDLKEELDKKNKHIEFLKSQHSTVAYKNQTQTGQNFYPNYQQNHINRPMTQQQYVYGHNNAQFQNQLTPQQQIYDNNNNNNNYLNRPSQNPFLNNTAESIYIVQPDQAQNQQYQQQQEQQRVKTPNPYQQQQHQQFNNNTYQSNEFMQQHQQQQLQDNIQMESQVQDTIQMESKIDNSPQPEEEIVVKSSAKVIFDERPDTIEEDSYSLLSRFLEIYTPRQVELHLIYRGSRDGYEQQDFHKCCDGQEKTIVLIKSWDHDKTFGGYLSVPWEDCDEYIKDENAFIFSIDHQKKFQTKNPEFSVYVGGEYLLCFGNDIMIGENCNEEEACQSQFPRDYQCNFPIDDNEKTTYLTGAPEFQVYDIEVYKIASVK